MYGTWIGFDSPIMSTQTLTTGETVYIIVHGAFTKMVTESGVAKYYAGKISEFRPSNWNSYNDAGDHYKVRLV